MFGRKFQNIIIEFKLCFSCIH